MKRKIVSLDRDKCDGCGICVPSCAEGAIGIVGGKAVLAADKLCDGLGACLGRCPRGAITIVEREAEGFDEAAVAAHKGAGGSPAALANWPVQLHLVPPNAPWLIGADLLVAADCVPFACADFHRDILPGKVLVVACPKLDDIRAHKEKLAEIFHRARPRSVTIARMRVPCCGGLTMAARQALAASGWEVPLREIILDITGQKV
jgi:NAD-dependent dihydropyrimidine dehydrogenase PreA subunit